jgi:FtsH-binding integral membrane protein
VSNSPQQGAAGFQVSVWKLRAIRVIALCSVVAILVPWYAAIFSDFGRQDLLKLLIPILFFPLWLPYAWVLWSLRSYTNAHTVKKALAVVVVCSSLILVLSSVVLVQTSFDADPRLVIVYALVALLQIALLVGAMTAYYSMNRESKDLQILVTGLWIPIVGVTVAAIIVPNIFIRGSLLQEASSVGSLRTSNVAQVTYAQAHPDKGFASSLAQILHRCQ